MRSVFSKQLLSKIQHLTNFFFQKDEIDVPKPLLCDDFAGRMETCTMWLSAGGTRSLLHSDSSDNFNCLYDGAKEIWLAHPVRILLNNYQIYDKFVLKKVIENVFCLPFFKFGIQVEKEIVP